MRPPLSLLKAQGQFPNPLCELNQGFTAAGWRRRPTKCLQRTRESAERRHQTS
jgi:hypothetical protein